LREPTRKTAPDSPAVLHPHSKLKAIKLAANLLALLPVLLAMVATDTWLRKALASWRCYSPMRQVYAPARLLQTPWL
jgi:hypothetical protein